MSDHDHSQLATSLAVALIPSMGEQPADDAGNDAWHTRFQHSLLRLSNMVTYEAPRAMQRAIADHEYFAEFYGHEGEEKPKKCIRFGQLIAVEPTRGRVWLPVLTGWGKAETTLEEAQELWQVHGANDLTLYHRDGALKERHGMELYRSAMLNDESGYGMQVKQVAERSDGKFVRIFRLMESWTGDGKASGEMKVAVRLEPIDGELDLKHVNPESDDDEAPARPPRRTSATSSRRTTPEPPKPAADPEPQSDGLGDFFQDEKPEEVPTFADFRSMAEAAQKKGYTTKQVMDIVTNLKYKRESLTDLKAVQHIYEELVSSVTPSI